MKISKATIETYETTDRATKKTVRRHRVRWRAYATDGAKAMQCKVSGFETKGKATSFIDHCLDKARFGIDDWYLDERGYPQRKAEVPAEKEQTALDLVRTFVQTVWNDRWVSGTRSSKRGRLLIMVAMLVDDPETGAAIDDALAANAHRHSDHKPPATDAEWVAHYLRHHALRGDTPEPADEDLGAKLAAARSWLETHSLPVSALNYETLRPLRRRLTANVAPQTGRNYWSTISACFNWGCEVGILAINPEIGLTKLRRDLDEERVDVKRVPGQPEIAAIADAIAERASQHATNPDQRERAYRSARVLILVLAYCALRIGEALALRRSDVRFDSDGAAWITVFKQDADQIAADSDDGATTLATTPTKGRKSLRSNGREIRLHPKHAAELRDLLDRDVAARPDARLFQTRLGRRIRKDTFRGDIWNPTIASLFPEGHRLHGIKPHALRSAGMTLWLRSRVPLKVIQIWGGWASLKVMLDTYSAVLDDDLLLAAAAMDQADAIDPGFQAANLRARIAALTAELHEVEIGAA